MPNNKSKHFNNSFHKNKLIIFKTWAGSREIINAPKKGKTDITSIQIGNKPVEKSSGMNQWIQ